MNSFHLFQCRNKEFDTKINIPYVLKCNHFFCKTCFENYFTDEEGLKCPIDVLVGKTLNGIQILSDFNQNNNTAPLTSHGKNMKNSINNKKIQNNTFEPNVNNMLNDENLNFMINTYDEKEVILLIIMIMKLIMEIILMITMILMKILMIIIMLILIILKQMKYSKYTVFNKKKNPCNKTKKKYQR